MECILYLLIYIDEKDDNSDSAATELKNLGLLQTFCGHLQTKQWKNKQANHKYQKADYEPIQ